MAVEKRKRKRGNQPQRNWTKILHLIILLMLMGITIIGLMYQGVQWMGGEQWTDFVLVLVICCGLIALFYRLGLRFMAEMLHLSATDHEPARGQMEDPLPVNLVDERRVQAVHRPYEEYSPQTEVTFVDEEDV